MSTVIKYGSSSICRRLVRSVSCGCLTTNVLTLTLSFLINCGSAIILGMDANVMNADADLPLMRESDNITSTTSTATTTSVISTSTRSFASTSKLLTAIFTSEQSGLTSSQKPEFSSSRMTSPTGNNEAQRGRTPHDESSWSKNTIIALAVVGVVLIAAAAVIGFVIYRRRRGKDRKRDEVFGSRLSLSEPSAPSCIDGNQRKAYVKFLATLKTAQSIAESYCEIPERKKEKGSMETIAKTPSAKNASPKKIEQSRDPVIKRAR